MISYELKDDMYKEVNFLRSYACECWIYIKFGDIDLGLVGLKWLEIVTGASATLFRARCQYCTKYGVVELP